MAERGRQVEIVGPLYSDGVGHARVYSPTMGEPPDPLGLLDPTGHEAPFVDTGSGDDTNDWTDIHFPDGGQKRLR